MKRIRRFAWLICWVGVFVISPMQAAFALEGLTLVNAGFTLTEPSDQEAPDTLIKSIKLSELKDKSVFFISQIECNESCQKVLQSGEVTLLHRWVRLLGVTPKTRLKQEFSPEMFSKSSLLLQSEFTIKTTGDWFVEIQASDGEKVCLKEKDEDTYICEFAFQVTLD